MIHPTSWVDEAASVGSGCEIGAGTVIESGACVGANCRIGPNCYLAAGVVLGERCHLDAAVSVLARVIAGADCHFGSSVVLGSSGFGFVEDQGEHVAIPQVGGVHIGDGVRIGSGSCVDRGTISNTELGAGCLVGAMVQIGHNCRIGAETVIEDLVGLAGSTHIGAHCRLEFQAGMAGHASLGDHSRLGVRGACTRRAPAHSDLWGFPARPRQEAMRVQAAMNRLPALIDALEARSDS
jgi:UDP-3-O-[3-hydroxymyristoyl] glucosamine N-acyltransferase